MNTPAATAGYLTRDSRTHGHSLAAAYYLLAVVVLSFYGIRVCPFIDSLDPATVVATFALGFGSAFALKLLFEHRVMPAGEPFTLSVYQFLIDFALFILVGLAIALYNHQVHQFPLESGYKVMVGCAMFGIFAGLDNGLRRERCTPPPPGSLTVPPGRIFPITRRLTVIFLAITIFTGIVAALVIIKDIDYLIENIGRETHAHLRRAVFIDVGFVIGVVLLLSLRLMTAYGNNLRYMLTLQIAGLSDVATGNLDTAVPVITRDEFSLIATKTNQMIETLRRANREQHELLDVSLALATELRLGRLLQRIVATTREFVDADRVSLFLHDASTGELWARVAEGVVDQEIRFAADQGIAGQVFTTGRSLMVHDAYADRRFNRRFDQLTGYRTRNILCVPIVDRDGKAIGVIQALNRRSGRFSQSDARRLRSFAAQAAVALVNAQLFADLDRMRRYNESVLRSLTNGVITLDSEWRVVKANAAAIDLLAIDGDPQGQGFVNLLGGSAEWWLQLIADEKEAYLADTEITLANGATRSVNLVRVPLSDLDDHQIGSMLVLEDVTEEKRVRNTLSRYLPGRIAERVLTDAQSTLGGVNQCASVLFSDIRSFTSISERLGARETVSMLNEYFTAMADPITANDGILDKYIGDAIMAVFGVPFAGPRDADNALTAAIGMLEQLEGLNRLRLERGGDRIAIGIGISTGDLVAGNVGSPKRMDFTVIGDTVNLAARLESATKIYGVSLVISGQTRDALQGDYPLRELDLIRVRGKDESVALYQVMAEGQRLSPEAVARYLAGRSRYARRDWSGAIEHFESVLENCPEDGPSQLFVKRCRDLLAQPPGADWDAVTQL